MKKIWFIILMIFATLICLVAIGAGCVFGAYNGAVNLEASIEESKSNILISEQKTIKKFGENTNLVELLDKSNESYNEVLKAIADARNNSSYQNVSTCIKVIHEAYPERNGLFETCMNELILCVEEVGNRQFSYNELVTKYKAYCRRQPKGFFLSISGYKVVNFEHLKVEEI